MKTTEQLVKELEDLTTFIQDADTQTREMKEVSLGDLDLQIAQLCEEAKGVPAEESALVQEPMMNMINALEELAESLKVARDTLEDKA